MTAPSCSLSVVVNGDTMTFTYSPPDNVARTVWVDGQPTTMPPHTTAVVRRADTLEYPTQGEVIAVADLNCGSTTTTTSTTTSSTVPTTTSTSALTTLTVVRTTPEPTTSTAPLPPATWTIVDTPTTAVYTGATLPATGASSGDIATGALLVAWAGLAVVAIAHRIRRRG